MLSFPTEEKALKAIQRINKVAFLNWKGKKNGNLLIDESGGITETWDKPRYNETTGKYEVTEFTNDNRFNKINLHKYSLGLPIDANGNLSGNMLSLYDEDILSYESDYFKIRQDGVMVFRCPDSGASSPNSDKARTELRLLKNYSYTQNSEHTIIFSIMEGKKDNSVIVHQIHGDDETFYMATLKMEDNGKHYLRIFVDKTEDNKNTVIKNVKLNIKYGDKTKLRAVYKVDTFYLYVDDVLQMKVTGIAPRVKNKYYYYKAGAYYAGVTEPTGSWVEIWHYPI